MTTAGITSLFVNASTFFFYSASIRSLGIESSGLLLSIIAAILMLSSPFNVASLTLGAAAARLHAADDARAISALVGTTLVCFTILFAGAIGLGSLTAGSAVSFFGGGDDRTIVAGAALFAGTSALVGIRGLVQGAGLFRTLAISNMVEGGGRTALAIELLHRHASVNQALVSISIVICVVTALTICMLVRREGLVVRVDFRLIFVRSNSLQLFITMGSIAVLTFLDAVVSRHFLTAYQSGLYNAAALSGRALMTVLAFAPAVIVPKLIGATARGESTVTIVRQTATLLVVICAPAVALFFLAPDFVIRIVAGPGFHQAAPLVGRYGFAAAALAAGNIVCSMRIGRGDFRMAPFVLATTVSEAIAFVFFHASPEALVAVVVFGHSATFLATLVPASGLQSDHSVNAQSSSGKNGIATARKPAG